eukprot:9201429-Alexandrium_andersonii.AAC.1
MSNTMSNVVHEQNQRQLNADSKLDVLGNMMQQMMASQTQLQNMMASTRAAAPPAAASVAERSSTPE